MPRNLYMGIIITVFTAVIALDQITKHVVMTQMVEGQSIDIIGEFLRLVYVENPGAAFSSFSGQRLILIGFPIMVILAGGLYLLKHRSESIFLNVTLSMILAGGVGNLIDRIAKGSVTDMISFSIFPPVFNVADIAVTVGCVMLLVYILIMGSGEE